MEEVKKLTVKNVPVTIKPNTIAKEPQKKPAEAPAEDVRYLSAKLHPEYDKDLKEAILQIPKRERSKLYRDAVRMYLNVN